MMLCAVACGDDQGAATDAGTTIDAVVADAGVDARPPSPWAKIRSFGDHNCAIRDDGSMRCWGGGHQELWLDEPGPFKEVDISSSAICAIGEDEALHCFGSGQLVVNTTSPAYRDVAFSRSNGCALRKDDLITCWPGEFNEFPVSERFRELDGDCAIRQDGSVLCMPQSPQLPPGEYHGLSVASGSDIGCVLDEQNALHCFGTFLTATPPAGAFSAVAYNAGGGCAIGESDGTLTCWNDSAGYGQYSPPGGAFETITIGESHACGIQDGEVVCWGRNNLAQGLTPEEAVCPRARRSANFGNAFGMDGVNGISYVEAPGCSTLQDGPTWRFELGFPDRDEVHLVFDAENFLVNHITATGEKFAFVFGISNQYSLTPVAAVQLVEFATGIDVDLTRGALVVRTLQGSIAPNYALGLDAPADGPFFFDPDAEDPTLVKTNPGEGIFFNVAPGRHSVIATKPGFECFARLALENPATNTVDVDIYAGELSFVSVDCLPVE
jgi:hypothetical protein